MRTAFFLMASVAAGAALASERPPTRYPEWDATTAPVRVAVVEVLRTGDLEPFPECQSPDVLCLDGPPTWYQARLLVPVQGPPPPPRFFAATTSHYGRIDLALEPGERQVELHLLRGQDDALVLERYARAVVDRDAAGDWHLVLSRQDPIAWLPCGLEALGEPIADPALAEAHAIAVADADVLMRDGDERRYRREGDRWLPRESVRITRLSAWLAEHPPGPGRQRCPPEASDD